MKIIKTQETLHKEKYKKFRDKVISRIKKKGYFLDIISNGTLCIQKEKGIFKKSYFLDTDYNKIELRVPARHDTTRKDVSFFNTLEKEIGVQIVKYI